MSQGTEFSRLLFQHPRQLGNMSGQYLTICQLLEILFLRYVASEKLNIYRSEIYIKNIYKFNNTTL